MITSNETSMDPKLKNPDKKRERVEEANAIFFGRYSCVKPCRGNVLASRTGLHLLESAG